MFGEVNGVTVTGVKFGRVAGVAVGLVIVGLITSGCSLIAGLGASATPKVGDCWQASLSTVQKTENWGGKAAVACTQAHQLYTYAVPTITKKFTGSWVNSSGTVDQDVDDAAYEACYAKQLKVLGNVDPDGRIWPNYFLPSVKQWEAGARWVRCDVTEIRVGSTIAKPRFANLPSFASITSALKSAPRTYALCENDPANNGPDGKYTTYADCTGAADWSLTAELTMKDPLTESYPGLAKVTKEANAQCATLDAPKGHTVFVEPPTESAWNDGGRELDCWLNNN